MSAVAWSTSPRRASASTSRLRGPAPAGDAGARDVPGLGETERTIERDPAHHLGLGEVRRGAADLPDARVELGPRCAHEVGGRGEAHSSAVVEAATGVRVEPRGLQQMSVDVELQLGPRGIADPNRLGTAVAGHGQHALAVLLATVEAVEHVDARMGQL
jgi:hypothetical protein